MKNRCLQSESTIFKPLPLRRSYCWVNWHAAAQEKKKKMLCSNFGLTGIHFKPSFKTIILLKSPTQWSRDEWTLSRFFCVCVLLRNIRQLSKYKPHCNNRGNKVWILFLELQVVIVIIPPTNALECRFRFRLLHLSPTSVVDSIHNGYFNHFQMHTQKKKTWKVPQGQNEVTWV